MKISMTDMLTASCQAESLSRAVIGKCMMPAPIAPDQRTFLRPIRSDSLPQKGCAAVDLQGSRGVAGGDDAPDVVDDGEADRQADHLQGLLAVADNLRPDRRALF